MINKKYQFRFLLLSLSLSACTTMDNIEQIKVKQLTKTIPKIESIEQSIDKNHENLSDDLNQHNSIVNRRYKTFINPSLEQIKYNLTKQLNPKIDDIKSNLTEELNPKINHIKSKIDDEITPEINNIIKKQTLITDQLKNLEIQAVNTQQYLRYIYQQNINSQINTAVLKMDKKINILIEENKLNKENKFILEGIDLSEGTFGSLEKPEQSKLIRQLESAVTKDLIDKGLKFGGIDIINSANGNNNRQIVQVIFYSGK